MNPSERGSAMAESESGVTRYYVHALKGTAVSAAELGSAALSAALNKDPLILTVSSLPDGEQSETFIRPLTWAGGGQRRGITLDSSHVRVGYEILDEAGRVVLHLTNYSVAQTSER